MPTSRALNKHVVFINAGVGNLDYSWKIDQRSLQTPDCLVRGGMTARI